MANRWPHLPQTTVSIKTSLGLSAPVRMRVTRPFRFTSVVLDGDGHSPPVHGPCCESLRLRCAEFAVSPHSRSASVRLIPFRSALPSLLPLPHHWTWQQSQTRVIFRY